MTLSCSDFLDKAQLEMLSYINAHRMCNQFFHLIITTTRAGHHYSVEHERGLHISTYRDRAKPHYNARCEIAYRTRCEEAFYVITNNSC